MNIPLLSKGLHFAIVIGLAVFAWIFTGIIAAVALAIWLASSLFWGTRYFIFYPLGGVTIAVLLGQKDAFSAVVATGVVIALIFLASDYRLLSSVKDFLQTLPGNFNQFWGGIAGKFSAPTVPVEPSPPESLAKKPPFDADEADRKYREMMAQQNRDAGLNPDGTEKTPLHPKSDD